MGSSVTVYDGVASLLGGMNAAVDPSILPETQAANIVNGVCRGGKVGNRPGVSPCVLSFASDSAQARFSTGNFQGCGYYSYPNAAECIIFAIGGFILRGTPQPDDSFLIEDFNPDNDPGNNPTLDRVYMCQSNDWFIIQDGQSPAILIQGNVVRRAKLESNEIPIGTIMAYGFGRTWVCTGANQYVASDLIGESDNAVILFTDNQYLAENASFQLPPKMGPVTGMGFYELQDTATGQGPLLVFGRNGAESVNVSLPRTSWQTSQIQVEALTNIGALGHRSLVNVNGDLFFRSLDGWRSYKQARGEQGVWGNLPMSTGVRPYTDSESRQQLAFGSAIFFDNRLIVTCCPRKSNRHTVHEGLLSLDFDPISSTIGVSSQPPAWDGFWSLPRPTAQLLSGTFLGRARAFAFTTRLAYGADGSYSSIINGLDELVAGRRYDDNGTLIVTTIETRAFACGGPYQEKDLERLEAFQKQRSGNTSIAVSYRNDGNPNYLPLRMATPDQQAANVLVINPDGSLTDAPPLYTVDNRSSFPDPAGNPANARLSRRFYRAQLQITLTGSQSLDQLRLVASTKEDSARGGIT